MCAKHRRLLDARAWLVVCIALLTAAKVSAGESCVHLDAELPRGMERCVSARQLCQSYQLAAANSGATGGDEALLVQSWELRLRGHSAPDAHAADELELELDAMADGRAVGQRRLTVRSSDCAALPDALAWVLVLLAQDAASAPQPAAAAPSTNQRQDMQAAAPPQLVAAESPDSRAPMPASPGRFALGAGAGVWVGVLPSAAFALQLQAAVTIEPIAYRLRATVLWPQQLDIAEGSVLMRDYELAIEACPGLQLETQPRVELRVCAGPRLGLLYASARDFALRNDEATQFLLYFGVAPEASLALGRNTWLQLSTGAAVGLMRPRIAVAFGDGQSRTVLPALRTLRAELMLSLLQIF